MKKVMENESPQSPASPVNLEITGTIPPHLDHPAVQVKCAACPTFVEPVAQCEEVKCCWAYQRRGHEQRVKDDARLVEEMCHKSVTIKKAEKVCLRDKT
jgi:hypothetical protein